MSHVIKEEAGLLGITLKHATTEHAQTIGMLERSHASIKQALKKKTCERCTTEYASNADLTYKRSYHAIIACESSRVIHGRIACKLLDSEKDFRDQTEMIF